LVLPSRAFGAVGRVGINFNGKLASRAILTKPGTFFTKCSWLAFHTVGKRIVIIFIDGIVRNECVGWAYFSMKVIQFFVLVATSTTNNAWFCFGNVFVTKFFANVARDMLGSILCRVENVLTRWACFAGC